MARSNRVPIRLAPFGRDWHVLRTGEVDADLLGARLTAIDGATIDALRSAAHSLVGGLPSWRDRQAPLLFESPEQLHAMGLARAAGAGARALVAARRRTAAALRRATERYDYRGGCKAFSDCHGDVVQHPIAIAALKPGEP